MCEIRSLACKRSSLGGRLACLMPSKLGIAVALMLERSIFFFCRCATRVLVSLPPLLMLMFSPLLLAWFLLREKPFFEGVFSSLSKPVVCGTDVKEFN